jgi:hypothetical protein
MACQAQHRRRIALAGVQIAYLAKIQLFAVKAKRVQTRRKQILAAGVIGGYGLASNQLFQQIDRRVPGTRVATRFSWFQKSS